MNVFIVGLFLILLAKSCHGQCRHWLTPELHYFDDNKETSAGTYGSGTFSIVGLPAHQSSTYPGLLAGNAVDGSSSSMIGSCSHTFIDDPAPWWRVDLGVDHCIGKVRVLNRGVCCSDRLTGAVVRAGNSTTVTDNPTCGSPVTADQAQPLGGTIDFDCRPQLRARYISVDIPHRATLQLCEVTAEEVPLDCCLGKSNGA
ncbi:fucolectin-1-like [Patiria miniata]|uniref:Fucolectin tachylectin-4 pentraxin-1 domain-containing protein n=1 Tax=Patiria miniata TaxID=46514 RepID=A0A914AMB3_PATMI|nr:fucolectin-1-like [Patiria miniata]